MAIESVINTQNSEIIEIFEQNEIKIRPIRGGQTRKLSQSIGIPLKAFLKHIISLVWIFCPRDLDEDIEIVTFDEIILYTSIPHEFGLEALDYFLTKYQEDVHPRFRKELVLESANFILPNNTLTLDSEFY